MVKLFILIGLPGSGKSTVAKELSEEYDALIFSSDTYRKNLLGDENRQDKNELVFTTLYNDLREALSQGRNCIFDATNTSRKSRRGVFNQTSGLDNIEYIAYVMRTSYEECLYWDAQRNRKVGAKDITKFYVGFQFPQFFEGFSSILIDGLQSEYVSNASEYLSDICAMMQSYHQMNPHHIYNLYDHCIKLAEHYPENSVENIAAKYHDLGKLYTRSFDDQGIAHYYGHDSVGAYKFMQTIEFWLSQNYSMEEVFEMIFYINYHMKGHKDIRHPKAEVKYRALFGNERYEKLIRFANCDMIASGTYEQHSKIKESLNNG
jgi:predicted kinase